MTILQAGLLLVGTVQGRKLQKDRITVAVYVNATGTDRMKLIVIHSAKRPQHFGKTWQPSEFVDYFDNKKAWMNMKACAMPPAAVQPIQAC